LVEYVLAVQTIGRVDGGRAVEGRLQLVQLGKLGVDILVGRGYQRRSDDWLGLGTDRAERHQQGHDD
jgi:hypothetical protein